jgi:hypothetical protein
MGSSVGLGGITLVLAAVVWLLIFVPGYAKRSQLKETTNLVKKQHRAAQANLPLTPDERLTRLINTQRGFSVLFGLMLLAAIASAVAAISDGAWWFGFFAAGLVGIVALFIQRAAGNQAAALAAGRHRSKQAVRDSAKQTIARPESRDWTPNRIPAPLQQPQQGELAMPLAEVIDIKVPKNKLTGSEIDAILARRRAI